MTDREGPEGPSYMGVSGRRGRGGRRMLAGVMIDGRSPAATTRLLFGASLVLFGLMWTFDNLGWTLAGDILRWWPVALLAYGLSRLSGVGLSRSPMQGVFFSLIGGMLVAARIANVGVGIGVIFPVMTILAGITFVRRALAPETVATDSAEASEEFVRTTAIMGSATTRTVGTSLQRGELLAMMGGIELDLRESQPASGQVAIEATAIMGGIEIIVPENWLVESDLTPIAGGFEDLTSFVDEGPPACTLRLTGAAIMGGVVTRNSPSGKRTVRIQRRGRD